MLDSGVIPTVEVSVEKIFTSELRQRIADLAIDLLGPDGLMAHRADRPRWRLLRAALPRVAADALRRRHQRGAARRDRPARSRNAVLRAVTACDETIPDHGRTRSCGDLRTAGREPIGLVRALRTRTDRRTPALWKALAEAGVLGLALAEYDGAGGSLDDLGVFCIEAGRALCPTSVHSTFRPRWPSTGSARRRSRPLARRRLDLRRGARPPPRSATRRRRPRRSCVARRAASRTSGGSTRTSRTRDRSPSRRPHRGGRPSDEHPVVVSTSASSPLAMMGGHRGIHRALRRRSGRRAPPGRPTSSCAGWPTPRGAGLSRPGRRRRGGAATAPSTTPSMREQFGRPIASFQAAQHLVADMHIALAAARLAAQSAVFWIGRGHTATRETAVARMRARRGQEDHAGRAPTARRHGLRRRHRPAPVLANGHVSLSTLGGGADVAAEWLERAR